MEKIKLIITHENADFDSYGAIIGAKKIYPDALISFPSSKEPALKNLLKENLYRIYEEVKFKEKDLNKIDTLILVDVNQKERIGIFGNCLQMENPPRIIIYDHHPEYLCNIKAEEKYMKQIGSTSALITNILEEKGIFLDPLEATLMLLGIYEDTGCFTFNTTTADDFKASNYLSSMGANIKIIADIIQNQLNEEMLSLYDEIIQNLQPYQIKNKIIYLACIEKDKFIQDTPMIVNKVMRTQEIDILFLLISLEKRIYIIARSRIKDIDVSKIIFHFNGGGHPAAASAVVKNKTLLEVKNELLKLISQYAESKTTASSIMNPCIKTIASDKTIQEAFRLMNKYRINSLPVIEKNNIVGLITRQIVDNALFRKMHFMKVKDLMGEPPPIVSAYDDIEKIQKVFIDSRSRLIIVAEKNQKLGVITRMELLKQLYEINKSNEALTLNPPADKRENIWNKAEKILAPEIINRLEIIGKIAHKFNTQAYLVGGIVRDIILGYPNNDIDIVIEGNAINFAKEVQKELSGKITIHQKHGTATITFSAVEKIYFTTARTEYYNDIAASPVLEPSSLYYDLYRRDFTINTLAMKLNPESKGELIDFFGGLKDINIGTIRILHSHSFLDDPARIFRAIRFINKYNFSFSKETLNLFRAANKDFIIKKVNPHKLFLELKYILQEAHPIYAIQLLNDYKLLEHFHSSINFNSNMKDMLFKLETIINWFTFHFNKKIQRWLLYACILFHNLSNEQRKELAGFFQLSKKSSFIFINYQEEIRRIYDFFQNLPNIKSSEIYSFLGNFYTDILILALTFTTNEEFSKSIKYYLDTRR